MKNIAIIPARLGSVGFKFKNRKFFDLTADFIDKSKLFDEVVVTTNDEIIKEYSQKRKYTIHHRNEYLSGGDISIKAVFVNMVEELKIDPNANLWLFYLPIIYKNQKDFSSAVELVNKSNLSSLMSFVSATTHPYTCWKHVNGKMEQFIANNAFRRQDMPEAWTHYHYVCSIKASYLSSVNDELIGVKTHPLFLDQKTKDSLIEIDTPEDYEKAKALNLIS